MSDISISKGFEDKMKDRIKDSIGDLITDEELSKLIKKGIDEVYFKPVEIKSNNSWGRSTEGPSLMEGIIKELLEEKVKGVVHVWMSENSDKVNNLMDEIVTRGIGKAVMRAFSMEFENSLVNMQMEIQNQLNNNM